MGAVDQTLFLLQDRAVSRRTHGEDIPLACRIISIVDSYDAMSTSRPYQRERSHREIMRILESEQGERNDPKVFKAFAKVIDRHPDWQH